MYDVVFDVFAGGDLCVCGGTSSDDGLGGGARKDMESAKSVGDRGGRVCSGAGCAGCDGGGKSD